MLGLNLDYPLVLSTIIEHAAGTFGDTELVSHGHAEATRSNYRDAAQRSRRLASSLRRLASIPLHLRRRLVQINHDLARRNAVGQDD